MVVLIEEKQKTLEYQEKMNVDVENTTNKKNKIGDQYTKLLIIDFAAKKLFQQNF